MMNRLTLVGASLIVGAASLAYGSSSKLSVGAPAPSFEAVDSTGKSVSLQSLKGKYVVMEWCNFGCPYVQKHYNSGNMQALQRKYTQKGVVWLTLFSSGEGHHGFYPNNQLNKLASEKKMSSKLIPDPEGTIGKLYGAKNTPTMFIVDPSGRIAYMGGIDDRATSDAEDIAGAKNFVAAALDEAMAGKPISTATSRPYGCGIHYKS